MEVKLLTLSKNHSDQDGDLLPEFDDGIDTHQINIPPNKKFSRLVLDKDCFLGDCSILSTPGFGATGLQSVRVNWYYTFGKANYKVRVYVVDRNTGNETLIIPFGSNNWEERARGAINAGRRIKITVSGPQALLLYPLIWGRNSREILKLQMEESISMDESDSNSSSRLSRGVPAAVLITAIICTAIVASVAFVGLGLIIKAALDAGKCVDAKNGGINLLSAGIGEISLDIHDCASRNIDAGGSRDVETEGATVESLEHVLRNVSEQLNELKKKQQVN